MVIKALADEFGVFVVAREDHGFADVIAAAIAAALGHQHLQALVDGVGVEEPAVDGAGFHPPAAEHVLLPVEQIPLGFFLIAEGVVADAFARKAQRYGDGLEGHEEAVGDGLIEAVFIGGQAELPVEQARRCCGRSPRAGWR